MGLNRIDIKIAGAMAVVCLALAGCATTAQIRRGSPNYLAKGMVSAVLKGHEFYVAIGQVDLYRHRLFGGLSPTGWKADLAVAIQADKESGEVIRIVTIQSKYQGLDDTNPAGWRNNVTLTNGEDFALGDLVGGISVTDIQPYPHWLDALKAMRADIKELAAAAAPLPAPQQRVTTIVMEPPPFFPMFPFPHVRRHIDGRR